MDKALFNRVKQTLLTHCPPDTSGRVALVQSAWVSESQLLNQVEYGGNNDVFATQLLTTAVRYGTLSDGQHALIALLEVLSQRVGERERDAMNHLIMEVTRAYAPENIQKTHDIFLSYSSRELAAMQRVKAVLISEGFSVWTDEGLVAGTPDWVQAIDEALRASRTWVGLYSPIANQSRWIREEFLTAQALELPLFPVVIAGTELPMGLRGAQAVFIEHDWDALRRELIPALANALGKETPSMLQKRLDEQKAAYVRELEALRFQREQLELERQQQDLQAERKRLAAEQAQRDRIAAEQAHRERLAAEQAQRKPTATQQAPTVSRLAWWNPLHGLLLLMWLSFAPHRLHEHQQVYGANAHERTGSVLANMVSWLPLLIMTFALSTRPELANAWKGETDLSFSPLFVILPYLVVVLLSLIPENDTVGVVLGVVVGVTVVVVVGVAVSVAGGVAVVVAGGVAVVVAVVVAGGVAVVVAFVVAVGVAVGVAFVVAVIVAGSVVVIVAGGMVWAGDVAVGVAVVVAVGVVVGVGSSLQTAIESQKPSALTRAIPFVLLACYSVIAWVLFTSPVR